MVLLEGEIFATRYIYSPFMLFFFVLKKLLLIVYLILFFKQDKYAIISLYVTLLF